MLAPASLDAAYTDAREAVLGVLGLEAWPLVPVRWNRRLRRAGRAIIDRPRGNFRSAVIELSPAYFEVYPQDLHGILVHEIAHVALAFVGRPFGHGPEFKALVAAAGGLQHGRWLPGRVYRYRCPICASILERRRRAADTRWCASCVEDAAEVEGLDAFGPERALVLIGTYFQGPETAAAETDDAAEAHPGPTKP